MTDNQKIIVLVGGTIVIVPVIVITALYPAVMMGVLYTAMGVNSVCRRYKNSARQKLKIPRAGDFFI